MYSQFVLDESIVSLVGTGKDYYDNFREEFDRKLACLDKFIYLTQLFQILNSCHKDFLSVSGVKKDEFWKINKYLLNYVNSVYSYKEYVSCYRNKGSDFYKIQDENYLSCGMYRFICEYRNRIIHQSALIKDVDKNTGDPYIDLEELISYFEGQIVDSKNQRQVAKNNNIKLYVEHLKTYVEKGITFNERPYLSAKNIVQEANAEIMKMNESLCLCLWESEIRDCFEWIHKMLYSDGNCYAQTYAVEEIDVNTRINITYTFEEYFMTILLALGPDSKLVSLIRDFYVEKRYYYFFSYACNINDLIEGVRLLVEDQAKE